MEGSPHLVDATQLYSENPLVIMAGLRDGAQHAGCESCQKVMRSAQLLIERLLKEQQADGGRR